MAQILTGIVTSDNGDKTIVVAVHTRKTHAVYKKQYSKTNKIMAHDPKNEAHVGDKVQIVACRPLSAQKRHMLDKVLEKARILHVEPEVVPEKKAKDEEASEETK
jgi:small subunit ribosomal protein S17